MDSYPIKQQKVERIQYLLEHKCEELRDYILNNNLHYVITDVLGEKPDGTYNFSKKTEKDIDAFIKTLSDEQIDKIYFSNPPEQTPIIRLTISIRRIQAIDSTFENKNDEIERAKKVAIFVKEEIKIIENEILPLIKDEEAELAVEIMKVADYPYIRVFGDQMKYLKYDDNNTNVEDKLKNLYNHPVIIRKVKRNFIKQQLLKLDLSKSYEIPKKDIEHFLYTLNK